MEDEDRILRAALRPTDACLPVEQLGRYADGALAVPERTAAEQHIRTCLSCQAELALLREMTTISVRSDEAALVRDAAVDRDQRSVETAADRAAASSPSWRRFGTFRVGAAAAVALIGIVAGSSYLFQSRQAPVLPSEVTTGDDATRSLSIRLRGPVGEQQEAPQRFEWLGVDRAVSYHVRLMTVDRQELWSMSTSALAVDLPSAVQASIAPGRTLLWDVTAYGARGEPVAESGTQSFRVVPR